LNLSPVQVDALRSSAAAEANVPFHLTGHSNVLPLAIESTNPITASFMLVWQSASSLKNGWKPRGSLRLGDSWYSGWQDTRQPDYASRDAVATKSAPHIDLWTEELHLRGRIAAFREGSEYDVAT
jgi:hypothetical protein